MCVTPLEIPNIGPVACNRCWQCQSLRIKDWCGRCHAEQLTAQHTLFVTLTFGQDDRYQSAEQNINAKMLSRRHVQVWLKRLRKYTTGRVRMLMCGEYGPAKGRAHWHGLLFCEAMPPNVRFGERYMHWAKEPTTHSVGRRLWDFGFSWFEEASRGSAGYVLKYMTKPDGTEQKEVLLSTKPPLGNDYFVLQALQHVRQGLSPQSLLYDFGERNGEGKLVEYMLRGRAAYNYLSAFVDLWRQTHGNDEWPWSPLIDEHMEERRLRELRRLGEPDIAEARFTEQVLLQSLERRGMWHVSGTAIRDHRGGALPPMRTYLSETREAGLNG